MYFITLTKKYSHYSYIIQHIVLNAVIRNIPASNFAFPLNCVFVNSSTEINVFIYCCKSLINVKYASSMECNCKIFCEVKTLLNF